MILRLLLIVWAVLLQHLCSALDHIKLQIANKADTNIRLFEIPANVNPLTALRNYCAEMNDTCESLRKSFARFLSENYGDEKELESYDDDLLIRSESNQISYGLWDDLKIDMSLLNNQLQCELLPVRKYTSNADLAIQQFCQRHALVGK
jgi:hypothetical protein